MKKLELEIHPKIINLLSAQTWKKCSWFVFAAIYVLLRPYFQDWGLIFTLVYCVIMALGETLVYKLAGGKLR